MRRICLPLVVFLACLLPTVPAESGEDAAARKRAAEVVATLPKPTPAISLAFEGDLIIQDLWAGEISLTARVARLGSEWVWRVTETSFLDWQGGEIREKVMLHLGQDLAIRSGTFERSEPGKTISLGFSRAKSGLDVVRRIKTGEEWGAAEKLSMQTPPGASGTGGAVLLFLRAVKSTKGRAYALPWVPNPAFKSPGEAQDLRPLRLTTQGPATWQRGKKTFESSAVDMDNGGTSWTLHLSRDHKKLLAMVSKTGPVSIVPRGLGGERITADPAQPATTWKRAFLKFGFGYHMARKELLADAFHWEAMYEHEANVVKRWSKDRPLADFKTAWIQEFINNSKRRDVLNTRRLLAMTFATGKLKKESEDEVVFEAHPNFGGGVQRTYHLKRKDGVWGIVRIDF